MKTLRIHMDTHLPSPSVFCFWLCLELQLVSRSATKFSLVPTDLVLVIHLCQAFMYRKWFFLYTAVFAGFIELAGWSGRLWSSQNVDNSDAFTIQYVIFVLHCTSYFDNLRRIICTIVAPTPLLAANFIILSRIIRKLGESYSRLSPRRCAPQVSILRYIHVTDTTLIYSDSRIFVSCVRRSIRGRTTRIRWLCLSPYSGCHCSLCSGRRRFSFFWKQHPSIPSQNRMKALKMCRNWSNGLDSRARTLYWVESGFSCVCSPYSVLVD